jgi:hypothetical protein
MAGLAQAIYNPRSGERADQLPDPAELCQMADREAVRAHLFDGFIPAAYRYRPDPRWQAQEAGHWLAFLARHLEQNVKGPDLAWWQLWLATGRAPRVAAALAAGLVIGPAAGLVIGLAAGLVNGLAFGLGHGLAVGLAELHFGLVVGLPFGMVVGIAGGLADGLAGGLAGVGGPGYSNPIPSQGLRLSIGGLAAGLVIGIAAGLVNGLTNGRSAGLWSGLVAGLALGLTFVLTRVPGDLTNATSPASVLGRDRRAALALIPAPVLVVGLAAGLAVALKAGYIGGLSVGLAAGLAFVVAAGLAVGLWTSTRQTAWPGYISARSWLALRHQLPWRLMAFLDDAHQRGVLRQVGSVYQFRHIDLQRRLASHPAQHLLPASGSPGDVVPRTQAPGSAL